MMTFSPRQCGLLNLPGNRPAVHPPHRKLTIQILFDLRPSRLARVDQGLEGCRRRQITCSIANVDELISDDNKSSQEASGMLNTYHQEVSVAGCRGFP